MPVSLLQARYKKTCINAIIVVVFVWMPFVRQQWKLSGKETWSAHLMGYLPAELIVLGVIQSAVTLSHLSGSWNKPFFFPPFFFFVKRAWGCAALTVRQNVTMVISNKRAQGWHKEGGLGSHCLTIILQRGVQRNPVLFERQIATCRFSKFPAIPRRSRAEKTTALERN